MLAALQEDLKEILNKAVISGDLDKYKQFIDRAVRDILKMELYIYIKKSKIVKFVSNADIKNMGFSNDLSGIANLLSGV